MVIVLAAGYTWNAIRENISAGLGRRQVSQVVEALLNSPGHCSNIMFSYFTEFGATKVENSASRYTVYWTHVFGRPR